MSNENGALLLPAEVANDPDTLLRAADENRAAGHWAEAAVYYARAVALRPDAWPLRVQEGHCLKEAGDVPAALARYRAAEVLAPEDADLQLQIGHAHKLLGEWQEAALAYARAVALDPENADAWREASATAEWLTRHPPLQDSRDELAEAELPEPASPPYAPPPRGLAPMPDSPAPKPPPPGALPPHLSQAEPELPAALPAVEAMPPEPAHGAAPQAQAAFQLVLDVTDLIDYFNGARTPTGIQRVQMGIVGRAMAEGAGTGAVPRFASYDPASLAWHEVDAGGFTRLTALAAIGSDTEEPEWVAARDDLRRKLAAAPPFAFERGAVLVNLGNSWGFPEYFRALRIVQREHGLRYIPFVHDCVPLIVPEHCLQTMVQDYARWFGAIGLHAHGVLCNSENTLRDLRGQLRALLPGLELPGHVIRLDADPRGIAATGTEASQEALRALRPGESFALFVATIESRKDHLLVFQAWLQMLRRHGPAKIPRLVCVGKAGWHSEGALALLRNAPELQRHVVLLSRVSDAELEALYGRCAFTVYNSHYEGWGLPITEALAHGKVVVTARHSALTEAGGEAALYFTPQSLPDLQAVLERVILEPGFRAAQEAVVREKGRPRSWSAVKDEVFSAVRRMAAEAAQPLTARARLAPGRRYVTRRPMRDRPDLALALAEAVREGEGWHAMEDWGVWSRPGSAGLRLPLPAESSGTPLRLCLELRAPPAATLLPVRCTGADGTAAQFELELEPGKDTTFMLDLPPMEDATLLEVELENGEGTDLSAVGLPDPRRVGAGLRGLMVCRLDDHAARLAYLEQQSFQAPLA